MSMPYIAPSPVYTAPTLAPIVKSPISVPVVSPVLPPISIPNTTDIDVDSVIETGTKGESSGESTALSTSKSTSTNIAMIVVGSCAFIAFAAIVAKKMSSKPSGKSATHEVASIDTTSENGRLSASNASDGGNEMQNVQL